MVSALGIAVRDPRHPVRNVLAYYGAGLLAGSSVLALTLLLLNAFLAREPEPQFLLSVMAAVAGAWAVRAMGLPGLWYPRRRWQVPEHWRFVLPLEVTAVGYGALLGTGVLTDVVMPSFWMAFVLSALVASPAAVIVAWMTYALARFLMLLAWTETPSVDMLDSRLFGRRVYVAAANSIALAATSLVLISWII